jgi:uncharacterized membrane protein
MVIATAIVSVIKTGSSLKEACSAIITTCAIVIIIKAVVSVIVLTNHAKLKANQAIELGSNIAVILVLTTSSKSITIIFQSANARFT